MRVVGVARDAVHGLPPVAELDTPMIVYAAARPTGIRPTFVVRSDRETTDITPLVVGTLKTILPRTSWISGHKWAGDYDSMLAGRRFTAGIFATLSLASLVLATAGLFGVLSYAVGQRMREFSLRVALGAQRTNLVRLVFRESLVMALGGTAIGAFAGLYLGFEVWDWLWGVYPVDATALIIAEAVLLAVTVSTSILPALRASRADPSEVMRVI
jgi:ABC-type antimicrobial peptide transport system permease subunit